MEKPITFLAIGGVQFPVGFRFVPTDEDLIVRYLYCKTLSLPLPVSIIPEVDVFRFNPWDLPGDLEEKRYFFSRGRDGNIDYYGKKNMIRVSDGSGFWKVSGKEMNIIASDNKYEERQIVGVRKTLTFIHGHGQKKKMSSVGRKSSWVMDQFKLSILGGADWIVCRIYKKKNRVKSCNVNRFLRQPGAAIHIMKEEFDRISPLPLPMPVLSPCSSGVTFSTHHEESDDIEETSSAVFVSV